jgi:hypothetical protein
VTRNASLACIDPLTGKGLTSVNGRKCPPRLGIGYGREATQLGHWIGDKSQPRSQENQKDAAKQCR